MYSDEISDVGFLSADRIRSALEEADQAFWAAIAAAFPEIPTGDFAPDQTLAWEVARNEAVVGWLHNNAPPHDPDKHRQLAPSDVPRHITQDHKTEVTEINTHIDAAAWLVQRGLASTGDHQVDCALVWHHQRHPESYGRRARHTRRVRQG